MAGANGEGLGIKISAPNLQEKVIELIDTISNTARNIDNITLTIGRRVDKTFDQVDVDVLKITDDVKVFSADLRGSALPSHWVWMVISICLFVVLLLLIIYLGLRSRREFKKNPVQVRQQFRGSWARLRRRFDKRHHSNSSAHHIPHQQRTSPLGAANEADEHTEVKHRDCNGAAPSAANAHYYQLSNGGSPIKHGVYNMHNGRPAQVVVDMNGVPIGMANGGGLSRNTQQQRNGYVAGAQTLALQQASANVSNASLRSSTNSTKVSTVV